MCSLCVPDMSAEDPKSSGIEQQAGDEEQQVEVGVHRLHVMFPARHIMVAWRGGVDQGRIRSHSLAHADTGGIVQQTLPAVNPSSFHSAMEN